MKEPRDRGKKAAAAAGRKEEKKGRAGTEEGERRNNRGGLNTTVKSEPRVLPAQGPVPPAS